MKNMKKTIWLMGLVLLGATVLSACNDKKASRHVDLDDEDDTELVEDNDEELDKSDKTSDEVSEEAAAESGCLPLNALIAEEGEVWPHLGGTYAFGDGDGHNVIVDVDLDDCQNEEEVLRCTLTIADEAFAGTIDTHTGCITCRDNNGNEVFQGYMFNGGNLLRGCLNGKPVRYEGLCGL